MAADDFRPQRNAHHARHRVMVRHRSPSVDCLEEQTQAAEAMGDEYLAAILRKATARLADRLMTAMDEWDWERGWQRP